MPILQLDQILIPYSTPRPPGDRLAVSLEPDGRYAVDCRIPHVVATRGTALRLSGGRYETLSPPDPRAEQTRAELFAELRANTLRFCDQWRKGQRQFVERYFEFVAARVAGEREALADRLRPFGGLYGPDDWLFSAPRPIPQAWLSLDPTGGAAAYAPENMVMVDVAFWTREGPLAVAFRGTETPDPRKTAIRDALSRTGVQFLDIPMIALGPPPGDGIASLLPDAFRDFWTDEPIPAGPFKPALPERLAE